MRISTKAPEDHQSSEGVRTHGPDPLKIGCGGSQPALFEPRSCYPLGSQLKHNCAAIIATDHMKRVITNIDADYGDRSLCCRRHGVILFWHPWPAYRRRCRSTAGYPLSDIGARKKVPVRRTIGPIVLRVVLYASSTSLGGQKISENQNHRLENRTGTSHICCPIEFMTNTVHPVPRAFDFHETLWAIRAVRKASRLAARSVENSRLRVSSMVWVPLVYLRE